jgi:hypothetical protein
VEVPALRSQPAAEKFVSRHYTLAAEANELRQVQKINQIQGKVSKSLSGLVLKKIDMV